MEDRRDSSSMGRWRGDRGAELSIVNDERNG